MATISSPKCVFSLFLCLQSVNLRGLAFIRATMKAQTPTDVQLTYFCEIYSTKIISLNLRKNDHLLPAASYTGSKAFNMSMLFDPIILLLNLFQEDDQKCRQIYSQRYHCTIIPMSRILQGRGRKKTMKKKTKSWYSHQMKCYPSIKNHLLICHNIHYIFLSNNQKSKVFIIPSQLLEIKLHLEIKNKLIIID